MNEMHILVLGLIFGAMFGAVIFAILIQTQHPELPKEISVEMEISPHQLCQDLCNHRHGNASADSEYDEESGRCRCYYWG